MDSGFDFDVIQRSAGYLFRDGMTFTLTLTALAMVGGIFFGTLLANLVVVFGMRALESKVRVPGFIGATPGAGGH